jgi:hypothetical protein
MALARVVCDNQPMNSSVAESQLFDLLNNGMNTNMIRTPRISFLIPYFGHWPSWMPQARLRVGIAIRPFFALSGNRASPWKHAIYLACTVAAI